MGFLITDPGPRPVVETPKDEVWLDVDVKWARSNYWTAWDTLDRMMPTIEARALAAFGDQRSSFTGLKHETHVKFATRCRDRADGMFHMLTNATGSIRLPLREVSVLHRIQTGKYLDWWLYPPNGKAP